MNERILVVEGDPLTADGVALALRDEGFEVEVTADGSSALERARARTPHLVVLDIGLRGGISGMEVCRELRGESAVPILMLSSRDTEVDTVLGLEGGADDYVTKPFSLLEVVARVRALLRGRALARAGAGTTVREVGHCGSTSRGTKSRSRAIPSTRHRRNSACLRSSRSGPRRRSAGASSACGSGGTDRSLDTRACDLHVARLRRKIEADPSRPRRLLTVRAVGYKLVPA